MKFVEIDFDCNPSDRNGRGSVPYRYHIAKYALTNNDWCAFLNAVDEETRDRHRLYHKDMSKGILGGIDYKNGRFHPKQDWGNKPVVYVNFSSLLRYCNWLQTGNTEEGAYDLSCVPPKRRRGAIFCIPRDDEWYKAAYFDPIRKKYWRYPHGADEIPTLKQANFECGDELSVGPPFYLSDVDGFEDSQSPWGVVQMGGNVWEYLEDTWKINGEFCNKLRGGSFGYTETGLSADNTDPGKYDGRCYVFGARLVYFPNGWQPLRMSLPYLVNNIASWLINIGRRIVRRIAKNV